MQYQTDQLLISGIKNGDNKALELLYKSHFKPINFLVLNNNGTEDEAKDIYQEAVILFYEKMKDNSFELTCSIATYLYAICKRLWLRKLSAKSKYVADLYENEKYEEVEVNTQTENEIQFQQMNTALLSLGEPCKTIIEDYYIHNLSMNAIADKFGYTNADNAKNQKYKCLQRLKKLFFASQQNQKVSIFE